MANAVLLGVDPSEYNSLTPGGARELLTRLSKIKEREGKADAEQRAQEFKALLGTVGNLGKGIGNTNELLKKLIEKPSAF